MSDQYFPRKTITIAFVVAFVFAMVGTMVFVNQNQNVYASDSVSQAVELDLARLYESQIASIDNNLPIRADSVSTKADPVVTQAVVTSSYIYHTRYQIFYRTIGAGECYYQKLGYVYARKLSCLATVKITQTWRTRTSGSSSVKDASKLVVINAHPGSLPCPKTPTDFGTIKTEVWMLAWKVTFTATYLAETICKRVLWLSVDCTVNYSIGWDINITRCNAAPENTPTFYKWTTFTAQWKANFISSIVPIQFGHCYRSGVDPVTHREYDFHNC